MDFIWFNLFSTIESVGMFILMLALFRFRIKEYIIHIVFASFLLAQMSYFMRDYYHLANYVPLVYVIFTFLFVWLMFRVPLFYAATMAIIGYIAFIILQGLIILIGIVLNLYSLNDVIPFSSFAYNLQLITCLLELLIGWLLLRKRVGFTFVPFSDSIHIRLKGENVLFLTVILLAVILTAFNGFWALQGLGNIILSVIAFVLTLFTLIYLAIRREIKDD